MLLQEALLGQVERLFIMKTLLIGKKIKIYSRDDKNEHYYKLEKDVEGIGYCGNCPIKNKQKRSGA
ncbi:hypothetical protein [Priestia abyssalis]|uniref:hypothetical protein n=1 Tax=Priestia abyssalis TaxID=1221450 RepID=UPI000994DC4B|nr:hypothetical protein [Priestia abyssalis]